VVVHGGLWLETYGCDLMHSVCADLAGRGWLAWNLEYRRVGSAWSGGGWPATLADVAAGIDHLVDLPDLADPGRVVVLGHSAGAQLAMWAAARPHLLDGVPGARPRVKLRAAVSLAGILDLTTAADDRRSVIGTGVVKFLGGRPEEVADRYAHASPVEHLPLGIPQLVVHGGRDGTIPVDQSTEYARRAEEAGDPVELAIVAEASHMDLVDPRSPAWVVVADWLARLPVM